MPWTLTLIRPLRLRLLPHAGSMASGSIRSRGVVQISGGLGRKQWMPVSRDFLRLGGSSRIAMRSFTQLQGKLQEKQSESAPAPTERKPSITRRLLPSTPHENIYTIPNFLTLSRFIATPAITYLVLHDSHAWALGLFAYAGITDLVDGWLARRYNLQTVVGSVVDPMADKFLMTALTIALAAKGAMPVYLAVVILGRDGLLGLAALYYRYISLPAPKTMARYWDFSLPSAEVHPTEISKWNTAFQLALVGWTVAMPMLEAWGLGGPAVQAGLVGMQYFVATTTVWSGASYLYSKDAVKILSQEEAAAQQEKLQQKEQEQQQQQK